MILISWSQLPEGQQSCVGYLTTARTDYIASVDGRHQLVNKIRYFRNKSRNTNCGRLMNEANLHISWLNSCTLIFRCAV